MTFIVIWTAASFPLGLLVARCSSDRTAARTDHSANDDRPIVHDHFATPTEARHHVR